MFNQDIFLIIKKHLDSENSLCSRVLNLMFIFNTLINPNITTQNEANLCKFNDVIFLFKWFRPARIFNCTN